MVASCGAGTEPSAQDLLGGHRRQLSSCRQGKAAWIGSFQSLLRCHPHDGNRERLIPLLVRGLRATPPGGSMAGAVWEAQFTPGLFVAWLRAPRLASRARGAAGEPGCSVALVPRQEGAAERPPAADGGRGDAAHAPRGCPGSRQRAWPARLLLRLLRDQKGQGNRLHLSAPGHRTCRDAQCGATRFPSAGRPQSQDGAVAPHSPKPSLCFVRSHTARFCSTSSAP